MRPGGPFEIRDSSCTLIQMQSVWKFSLKSKRIRPEEPTYGQTSRFGELSMCVKCIGPLAAEAACCLETVGIGFNALVATELIRRQVSV